MDVLDNEDYSDDSWWDMVYENQDGTSTPTPRTENASSTTDQGECMDCNGWGTETPKCGNACMITLIVIVMCISVICLCITAILIRKQLLRRRGRVNSQITVSPENQKKIEAGLRTPERGYIAPQLVLAPPAYNELKFGKGSPPDYSEELPPKYGEIAIIAPY